MEATTWTEGGGEDCRGEAGRVKDQVPLGRCTPSLLLGWVLPLCPGRGPPGSAGWLQLTFKSWMLKGSSKM